MQHPPDTIVLDLDGTLIDTAPRHYSLYERLSKSFNVEVVTFREYWDFRRSGLSNVQVLQGAGLHDDVRQQTEAIWRRDIESRSLLQLDRVFPGVVEWLDGWRDAVHFVLITVRSNADAVREQLDRLDLLRYFTDVVVVSHSSDGMNVNIKEHAARERLRGRPIAWVGDTELDIQAARKIGARPIGVANGIRTAERLQQAGAVEIVASVTAIQEWPPSQCEARARFSFCRHRG